MVKRRSEWFPGEVKPAMVGVYQRDYRHAKYGEDRTIGIAYCHWNGKRWSLFDARPRGAELSEGLPSSHQNLPWRGLADDPRSPTHSAASSGEKRSEE